MVIEIGIDDRVYKEFSAWCKGMGYCVNTYIYDAFYEKYMVDKYGDINKILHKEETEGRHVIPNTEKQEAPKTETNSTERVEKIEIQDYNKTDYNTTEENNKHIVKRKTLKK